MEKTRKQKLIFNILSFIIVLSCACGIVFSYENIIDTVKTRSRVNQRIYDSLVMNIPGFLPTLDHQVETDKDISYDEMKSQIQVLWDEDYNVSKEVMNDFEESAKIQYLDEYFSEDVDDANIAYYVKDGSNGKIYATNEDLSNYQTDKALQDKYRLFIEVKIDDLGNISDVCFDSKQKDIYGENDIALRNQDYIYQSNVYNEYLDVMMEYTIQNEIPKNRTYIFAVNEDIVVDVTSFIYGAVYNYDGFGTYFVYLLPNIFIALFIVVLWMVFYPVRIIKECPPYRVLKDIKAEIVMFICFWMIGLGFMGLALMVTGSCNGVFLNGFIDVGWGIEAQWLLLFINIFVWVLAIYFVMYMIFMLKYIFHKGLIKYLKENTIVAWCYYKMLSLVHNMMEFDLESNRNRTIFKILGVNFIGILLLGILVTIITGFSLSNIIVFSIFYTIALFFVIKKEYDKIGNDYDKLLKATRKLSDGDFNIDMNENLGIFNSLRDEFTDIKNGFEKAVKEEVKSQRMKTELISNVSHDLKTPLTSIITYVDLLKRDELSEEERKQYVETLDRNALRLKNLIEDLFEVSKANSGNVNLNLVDVDVVALIKQAQFECLDKLMEAGLDMRMSFSQDKMICRLDSSKTYRIFENLFINISKYALPHTRVYVDAQMVEDSILINFKNISANEISFDAEEITERFVQGDKSRNSGGSGLGLAIAKSFTQLQGGSFKIEVDGDLFKAIIQFKR